LTSEHALGSEEARRPAQTGRLVARDTRGARLHVHTAVVARLYQAGAAACLTRQLRRFGASAAELPRHDGAAGVSEPVEPASPAASLRPPTAECHVSFSSFSCSRRLS